MGVPKFFRWLSERYPLINQRYHAPDDAITKNSGSSSSDSSDSDSSDSDSDDNNNAQQQQQQQALFSQMDDDDDPMMFKSYFNSEKIQRTKIKKLKQLTNTQDKLQGSTLAPQIDRLYIDMNGIIHGCSHNNSEEDGSVTKITHEEIFDNITHYLDRIVGDIIQPTQLIYMAIDGVAPRAKLNQQRSRRYRSTTGNEIEQTVYEAHMQAHYEKERRQREEMEELKHQEQLQQQLKDGEEYYYYDTDPGSPSPASASAGGSGSASASGGRLLKEVEPGRFSGKFETQLPGATGTNLNTKGTVDLGVLASMDEGYHSSASESSTGMKEFHSNSITPGTPFFQECTDHLEAFIKDRLANHPKWKHLTIIFSGPNVPGEGEHKIMDFMRRQKQQPNYDPNLRHCIQGQDGDLIMLGLVTHEPNLVLFREQVIFDARRRTNVQGMGVSAYVHNPNFEFLHMNVLRDYLSFDFETSNVVADSPFDLERTIDDFIFMTFFVGNDFLPPMPALDIADEAFDLLWYTYREHREKWYEEMQHNGGIEPYLTDAGTIVSGNRLEAFLSEVGSFESPYFDNKKEVEKETNARIRKQDKRYGTETIPDEDILEAKEAADRESFRQMMKERRETLATKGTEDEGSSEDFEAVLSSEAFQPISEEAAGDDRISPGLSQRLGNLLKKSVTGTSPSSPGGGDDDHGDTDGTFAVDIDDQDIKGRYYYDKFNFSPFDKAEHNSLRKAYIEGLVWNLKYYYEGCASWSWFYPYHYGPMLSDLVGIDNMLKKVSFEGKLGKPLKPFEQLMACMPPSQAHVLPEPYRPLMTDAESSIIDFYPQTFTVDMNGKRWPWEAVVLLPFIDTDRLLESTRQITKEQVTDEERARNELGEALVLTNSSLSNEETDDSAAIRVVPFESTEWNGETGGFQPTLKPGTQVPLPGLPTLRTAPIRSMWRRRMGLNVFGLRSRYKTACLEHSESMPALPPLRVLGQTLIGTTIWINFPHLTEAFVTAVSNENHSMRGTEGKIESMTKKDKLAWVVRRDEVVDAYERGQGFTGTGGLIISPDQDILLSVRPLNRLRVMPDGAKVKTFSKEEIDIPIVATLWAPLEADPRLTNVPALVEKNPYKFHHAEKESDKALEASSDSNSSDKKRSSKEKLEGSSKPNKGSKSAKQAKTEPPPDLFAEASPDLFAPADESEDTVSLNAPREIEPLLDSILPSAPPRTDTDVEDASVVSRLLSDDTGVGVAKKGKRERGRSGGAMPSSLLPEPPTSGKARARDSTKRNGEVSILPTSNNLINGSRREKKKMNGELGSPKRNGERRRPKDLPLFPSTPSHEDVWRPIEEDLRVGGDLGEGKDLGLFPLIPSHEDVWRPIEEGSSEVGRAASLAATGSGLPGLASTKAKITVEGEATRIVKATNLRWWESSAYNKEGTASSSQQQFTKLRQKLKKLPPHVASTARRRQYSTLASRQNNYVRGSRGRAVAAVGVAAAAFLFASVADAGVFGIHGPCRHLVGCSYGKTIIGSDELRGGGIGSSSSLAAQLDGYLNDDDNNGNDVPPLEFAHGTTTLSFAFQGGAIVAVDSRASMGSFVGSKTVQKVLPINSHMLGTMAGGAADCSQLIRLLRSEAMRFELEEGRRISTARVSHLLARILYQNRGAGLSVGTMIVGYDDDHQSGNRSSSASSLQLLPQIYYVDDSGTRLKGQMFSAGSGSTFALAILDTEYKYDLTEEEAIALGIKAIRYATLRDAFSGGFINVYVVTTDGWKKVFTEDVAAVVVSPSDPPAPAN